MTNGKTILFISLLGAITPVSASVTQLAQVYKKNAEYAGVINVVTTFISIITMPLLAALYIW